jgi:hypothetical protein
VANFRQGNNVYESLLTPIRRWAADGNGYSAAALQLSQQSTSTGETLLQL